MKSRKKELRSIVLDIVFGRESVAYRPSQFVHLSIGVAEICARRSGSTRSIFDPRLDAADEMLVQEIFWDLIVERVLTIGLDSSNRDFPWFRLHSEAIDPRQAES